MTSIGVEWDTLGLVYLGGDNIYTNSNEYKTQHQLPDGYIEKTPAVKGDKWDISLEMTNLNKTRLGYGNEQKLSDCLYSLEAQLGVFRSTDEKMFNLDDYMDTCKKFQTFWAEMIENKHITINNKKYPVLAHKSSTNIPSSGEYYIDCARLKRGFIQTKTDVKWVYTDLLLNVAGKPQITCGIKLKYIISLFSYITKLHNKCIQNDPNKQCLGAGRNRQFNQIKQAYYNTAVQIDTLKLKNFDTNSQNVIGMILLTNYMFIVIFNAIKTGAQLLNDVYGKSFFPIKLRSNLRYMYDNILTKKTKQFYNLWVKSMINIKEFAGFNDTVNLVSGWWESFSKSPLRGWVITGIKTNGLKIDVPPLGIFNISNKQYNTINRHLFLKKVVVDKGPSEELPNIVYRNNHIQYRDANEIKKFDYMEWISVNDTVFFELRGLAALFELTKITKTENYANQKPISVTSKSLCMYIGFIIKSFLNPMLQESLLYPKAPKTYKKSIKIPKTLSDDELLAELNE